MAGEVRDVQGGSNVMVETCRLNEVGQVKDRKGESKPVPLKEL